MSKPIDNCVLNAEQSKILWRTSFLFLFSSIYASHKNNKSVVLPPLFVFITSITYWKKPDFSIRRYSDIYCVRLSLLYQMIAAYGSQYALYYYSTLFVSLSFYPLGIYLYNTKRYWYSTYAHSMLHILSNVSNIILYSGYIVPFSSGIFSFFIKKC